MKTLGRIAIILIASLVVAGATVAFTQTSFASVVAGRGGRAGFERQMPEGQLPAGQIAGNFERHGRGEESGSLSVAGLAPIIKDVAIMGAIMAATIAATMVARAIKRSQGSHPAGKVVNNQGLN